QLFLYMFKSHVNKYARAPESIRLPPAPARARPPRSWRGTSAAVDALERLLMPLTTDRTAGRLSGRYRSRPSPTDRSLPSMGYVALLARLLCDGSLHNPRPDHAGPVADHLGWHVFRPAWRSALNA